VQALKLQQKMVPRALSDLQKNVTSAVSAIAAEMSSFHQRIADLEANYEVPSICLPDETQETGAGVFALDSGRRSPSQFASQQDVGPAAGGVQQGLDMHSIAQELAALRTAAERANRREFAMVSAAAIPFHGCYSTKKIISCEALGIAAANTAETAWHAEHAVPESN
jgi:hypothetical protein